METIIFGIRQKPEKKPGQIRIFLAIAASLVILLTAGILLFDIPFTTKPSGVGINSDSTDSATTVNEKIAEVTDNVADKKDTTERVPIDVALAETFQPLAVYENALMSEVRSEALTVVRPATGRRYSSMDSLVFEWKADMPLSLVIFNNKGDMIFENEVRTPYIFEEALQEGLYYWQLETPDESLFTGKFLIKD
jgi:hypothetical protein